MACFKCGTSADRALMYNAISPEGIVEVCKRCSEDIDFPIIKRSPEFKLKEAEKKKTVLEVLERISGVRKIEKKAEPEKTELETQETVLSDVIQKNLPEIIRARAIPTDQFIDNFHWVIMRYRRMKKLTQKELARAIGEPEVAVKMAEQGIISKQTPNLIEKIENYLGIRLKRDQAEQLMWGIDQKVQTELFPVRRSLGTLQKEGTQEPKSGLSFDPTTTRELTIGNLKTMREERETEKEKPLDEKKLTDKDIDDILLGRK